MAEERDETMIGDYTRKEWTGAIAVDGAMLGPIPDEELSEYLPDFDHLMFPRKWNDSGAGDLDEAASEKPQNFSLEVQDLANAIWQIRQEHRDDYEAAVRALVALLRENELQLEMIDQDGHFLVGPSRYR